MRCEVSVDLHGPGRPPAEALEAVRAFLGDDCRTVRDWPGAIRVSAWVDAASVMDAVARGRDQVHLAAGVAGLDEWSVVSWEGSSPNVGRRWWPTRRVVKGGLGWAFGAASRGDDGGR